jgi:HEAT repeat protein
MPDRSFRWILIAAAATAVAAGQVACDRASRVVGGLKRKVDQNTIGGDDVMSRLGAPATRAEAALEIGGQKLSAAVPALKGYLEDKDPNVRLNCVWALGEIADAGAIPDVRTLLTDHERKVRVAAAVAMGKLPGGEGVFWLGETMTRDAMVEVRLEAVRALATLKQSAGADWLARGLKDNSAEVRLAAARGLAAMKLPAAEPGLLAALIHEDKGVRDAVGPAVRELGKPVLARLQAVLGERVSDPVRLEVAALLGRIGGVETAGAMIHLLDNLGPRSVASATLRQTVVEALSAMGPPVLEPLGKVAIEGESNATMEQAAVEVCRRIGKPAVKTIVESICRFKLHPDVRELQVWLGVLGELGDPGAMPALNRALAQGVSGMDAAVAEARRKIEAASGRKLPDPAPDHDLLIGKAGPAAFRPLDRGRAALTPPAPESGEVPDDGVLRLTVREGLKRPVIGGRSDLEITLIRRNGEWSESFWGVGMRYNKREHPGWVMKSRRDGRNWVLNIESAVMADNYVQGGYLEYELALASGAKGLTGTYKGHMNHETLAGAVEGVSWRRQWAASSAPPLGQDEHPRLLFRKHHLPALREKAKTEFGRRIIDELRGRIAARKRQYREPLNWVTNWEPGIDIGIAHAFLGVLFDDPAHLARGDVLIEQRSRQGPYGGEHGERIPGPLFYWPYAADLVWNFTTPEHREQIAYNCRRHYINWSLHSGPMGIMAVGRGLVGIPGNHALMILGSKGPLEMDRPEPTPAVLTLPGEPTHPRRQGVPVNAFGLNAGMANWLVAGPLGPGEDDPLAALGGMAEARPETGMTIKAGGREAKFEPLAASAVSSIPGLAQRQCITVPGGGRTSRSYLYGLLEVSEAAGCGLVLAHDILGRDSSALWVDGQRCPDGSVLLLGKGLHRVLLEARERVVSVHFAPTDAGRVKADGQKHRREVEEYLDAKRRHEQTGVMQDIRIMMGHISNSVRSAALEEIAVTRQGGRVFRCDMNLPFIFSLWTATGDGLWPDTPLYLDACRNLVGDPQINGRHLAFAMGVAPDDLKGLLAEQFSRRFLHGGLGRMSCLELAAAFVNYPLVAPEAGSP